MEDRILYVPYKGDRWFWHLSADSLVWVRFRLTEAYGSSVPQLIDGILQVRCTVENTRTYQPFPGEQPQSDDSTDGLRDEPSEEQS